MSTAEDVIEKITDAERRDVACDETKTTLRAAAADTIALIRRQGDGAALSSIVAAFTSTGHELVYLESLGDLML